MSPLAAFSVVVISLLVSVSNFSKLSSEILTNDEAVVRLLSARLKTLAPLLRLSFTDELSDTPPMLPESWTVDPGAEPFEPENWVSSSSDMIPLILIPDIDWLTYYKPT